MKRYAAYLFDLYGTLVEIHTDESAPAFWREVAGFYTVNGASYTGTELQRGYLRCCQAEEAALLAVAPTGARVEIDLRRVFAGLYAAGGVAAESGLIDRTAQFFRRRSTTHLRTYAGAEELLTGLKSRGGKVILLSNAQRCFTEPELRRLGLWNLFDGIFISSDVGRKKPDPVFFHAALKSWDLQPADCLMIGNDPVCDIGGGMAAGMDVFFLRSGLTPKSAPEQPGAAGTLPKMDLKRLKKILLK